MKENTTRFKYLRVSMILMGLALMTSCIVGGTFAKYTTSQTGIDNARIAKFGVKIDANGKAFDTLYDSEEHMTVKSVLSTDNVIAPGTKGEMVSMSISGKPEVSVAVDFKGGFSVGGWEIKTENGTEFYCPIKITVGTTNIEGRDFTSAEAFAEAVNNAIAACSGTYDVKNITDDLSKIVVMPSVSWAWAFDANAEGAYKNDDEKDTYLANLACEPSKDPQEGNENASTINLIITTTVTQID